MKINWKTRFKNPNFVFRFIVALLIPALAGVGMEWQELTSWGSVWEATVAIASNPVVLAIMVYNAFNMAPDGTVDGWSDSKLALDRKQPKKNIKKQPRDGGAPY